MLSFRIPSMGTQPAAFAAKITDTTKTVAQLKSAATPTPHSTVTCGYQAHVAGFFRNVTVLWSKNLMNHSLTVMVSSLDNDMNYCCKIDLVKPWQFWSKRGSKSFDVEGNFVEVFWDLRSAKLSGNGSPEPVSDYYVAIVSDEEVVLLLGDLKHKAYKRTKSRPALVEGFIYFKKESIFGKKTFSTRARFDEQRKGHELVVESSNDEKDQEMWISVDGIVLVHVKNLQWKFRGNVMVLVDRTPVMVYYDVHDWLFGSSESTASSGLFLFKPVPVGAMMVDEYFSDAEDGDSGGGSSPLSRYNSASSGYGQLHEFCLFLYAGKLE
ncbi:uncharacterized protein LOC111207401 [Brassica napus]|uniref:(rape) hypothetical protein n=1 Tax=Brassica napus TaxID=3708 RepID=A0A816MNZ9_BRANA|nr:uncharacterized protein LOC111207401 [Brassica napus]CAF2009667.1 unnamed protein product [Brassica napus]